jgi:hypothetical protein
MEGSMRTVFMVLLVGALSWSAVVADEPRAGQAETTAGWVKYPDNPVLGDDLGTCFDVSVLKEGDTYRMWFSGQARGSGQ